MPIFSRCNYQNLSARQKENYNLQKLSGVLADYGYITFRLSDDWHGADMIALHHDGLTVLRIQLKGRLSFAKKYIGKDIHVAFRMGCSWYVYPHDELLDNVLAETNIGATHSWQIDGYYNFPTPPETLLHILEEYMIPGR